MSRSSFTSRRQFLKSSAVAAAGLTILPQGLRGESPNGKLRLGAVGVGGMGAASLKAIASHSKVEVVALCDVDSDRLGKAASLHPKAKTFRDWRKMYEAVGDSLDAVNVATPDHTHAPASVAAMNLGKHVYCQKPLTHDVFEARQMNLIAAKQKVVTQMGTQGHSGSVYRTAVATIRAGAIGKVKEVHSWSYKTWGYTGPPPKPSPVPETLAWDLWIGTAPFRPYSKGQYHPADWRRWFDFGCGTMGDMGIHILDPVATALELGPPRTILSFSPEPPAESFGTKNKVEYAFDTSSERTTNGFKLTWYDGDWMPESEDWPLGDAVLPRQGSMFVGEKGYLLLPHVQTPVLLPQAEFADYKLPTQPDGNHYHLWVDACLGGMPTTAGFGYAGPLTEILLLGVIANRLPTQKLEWDARALRIPNFADADALLKRRYRRGWEVDGLGDDGGRQPSAIGCLQLLTIWEERSRDDVEVDRELCVHNARVGDRVVGSSG